jgi:hypothetical protein
LIKQSVIFKTQPTSHESVVHIQDVLLKRQPTSHDKVQDYMWRKYYFIRYFLVTIRNLLNTSGRAADDFDAMKFSRLNTRSAGGCTLLAPAVSLHNRAQYQVPAWHGVWHRFHRHQQNWRFLCDFISVP